MSTTTHNISVREVRENEFMPLVVEEEKVWEKCVDITIHHSKFMVLESVEEDEAYRFDDKYLMYQKIVDINHNAIHKCTEYRGYRSVQVIYILLKEVDRYLKEVCGELIES